MDAGESRARRSGRAFLFVAVFCRLFGAPGVRGAETCDVDADGRVTLRDVVFPASDAQLAEGSLDGFRGDSCLRPMIEAGAGWGWVWQVGRASCFLEWVRRAVPGSLVPWSPIADFHVSQAPLPPDPRVVVRLEEAVAPGGDDDRLQLALWVESTESFSAFGLIVEADGDLLGSPRWDAAEVWDPYLAWVWRERKFFSFPAFGGGDLEVSLSIPAYLLSRGKYVVTFGLWGRTQLAPPGAYRVIFDARLPLGTRAGGYTLRVLPGSEIVLADGTVVAPIAQEASIVVEQDVTAGWVEGPVPLELDPERREVLGAIEFRLATASGEPREVVAEGAPGDPVAVLIQMRTEVPLNRVSCGFTWPSERLLCDGVWPDNPEVLFRNPEDGLPYPAVRFQGGETYCGDLLWGEAKLVFWLAGGGDSRVFLGRLEGRVLDYFRPLGVWTDVALVHLRIAPSAAPGEEIPLVCLPPSSGAWGASVCSGSFWPYQLFDPCESKLGYWSYPGITAKGARIRVREGPPPPPPPDYEIRVTLGDAAGRPGEAVELPVFASASEPLALLRLALELDPQVAVVEAVELVVMSRLTGEERTETVARGTTGLFPECIDWDGDGVQETCEYGQPRAAIFYATEERYAMLALLGGGEDLPYPGTTPRLLGRLRVRIAHDPALEETALVPATVPHTEGGGATKASSGGWKFPIESGARFSPLKSYKGGRIRVEGFVPKRFLRGDANGDGKVDISDAIATLGYLFLGFGEPECLDAADSDDSGHLDITDGIFLLGVLFLGAGTVPEPYPVCGEDPTPDGLGCRRGCVAG